MNDNLGDMEDLEAYLQLKHEELKRLYFELQRLRELVMEAEPELEPELELNGKPVQRFEGEPGH